MAKTPGTPEPETEADPRGGKGRATPTRREREAEHRRPLVQKDRRAASQQSRAQAASAREKARIGMATGDERYLPARDKGPQRRFARDYVDARFSIGEVLLPLLVLVIITSFFPEVYVASLLGTWVLIAAVVVDCIIATVRIRKRIAAKFGADRVERGLAFYVIMRAVQLRALRLPKPQVKRGEFPS